MLAIQTNKNRQFNTLIMFTGQQNKNCKYRHHSTELKHLIVILHKTTAPCLLQLSQRKCPIQRCNTQARLSYAVLPT